MHIKNSVAQKNKKWQQLLQVTRKAFDFVAFSGIYVIKSKSRERVFFFSIFTSDLELTQQDVYSETCLSLFCTLRQCVKRFVSRDQRYAARA